MAEVKYLGQPSAAPQQTSNIGSLAQRLRGFGAGLAAMSGNYAPMQQIEAEQTKMQNEALRKQAEQRAAEQFQLDKKYKEAQIRKLDSESKKQTGLKPLTPPQILNINEGNAIPGTLDRISEVINTNKSLFSPIIGKIRQQNPYDEQARVVDAEMRAASQQFGRFMEGGVLRKEDEEKYRKMFPQITDTPKIANGKLKVINDLMRRKQESDIKALKVQGFDLAGLDLPMKQNTIEQPSSLAKQAGGALLDLAIPSAQAAGLTPEDQQAIDWAKKNPNDPRSVQILQMHGIGGR